MLQKRKIHVFALKLIEKKADELPEWSDACKKALLLQPSSAASVFFPVQSNSFSNQQEGALRDYMIIIIQTSVIDQYTVDQEISTGKYFTC